MYGGIIPAERIYVYLHGAGEFGSGYSRQYQYPGFPTLLRDNAIELQYPFVIACCQSGTQWEAAGLFSYLKSLKEYFQEPNIDLIGYSRGGCGVYNYLTVNSDIRTATVINSKIPVSLTKLNEVPLHIIHAKEDQVAPIEKVRSLTSNLDFEPIKLTEWDGDHYSIEAIARSKQWVEWIDSAV